MAKKLKLALVTNARSDYTTMFPVIKRAALDPDVEPQVICGGMHLKKAFGETYRQIEADGFSIAKKLDYFVEGQDSRLALAQSLARGTEAFAQALSDLKPDFVVVSGDRVENLALYSATTALGLPVAHLCGGDITEGAFDDQVRHAMTKLSHLHFVSMEEHALRVVQMGEEPWRVIITGDAALDTLVDFKPLSREELHRDFSLPLNRDFVVSTFHPVTLGSEDFLLQFKNMLEALAETNFVLVFTYPNIDPGHETIVEELQALSKKREDVILVKSCTRTQYYSLMAEAEFLIGNSSSGIWEAPTFKTACINIGSRQQGRRRAENVVDVVGNSKLELEQAIRKVLNSDFQGRLKDCVNPYGSGGAATLTIETLKRTNIDDRLMMKKFFNVDLNSKVLTQCGKVS